MSERVDNSPLSLTLLLKHAAPDWRHAVTLSPFMDYSPHYAFHSAVNQTQLLAMIWQTARFTPEAKTQSCQTIIKLWQTSQRDDAAEDYLQALSALAQSRGLDAQPLTADELPGV